MYTRGVFSEPNGVKGSMRTPEGLQVYEQSKVALYLFIWGIFSWEDIDFSRFTFEANDAPAEIPFRRKVKNYKRLQILIKNDAVNEGFGVFCIVKHYVTGNFAKK